MENNTPEGMKKCSKCGEIKPATAEYYSRRRTKKDGLRGCCKECQHEYYIEVAERVCEQRKEYRKKNKEKIKEYLERTKEERAIKRAEYRKANREKIKEYDKKYKLENKEKIQEREKKYRQSKRGAVSRRLSYIRKQTGAKIFLENLTDEFITGIYEQWEKNEILYCAEEKIQKIMAGKEKKIKLSAIEDIKKRREIYCKELDTSFENATSAAAILGIDQGCISKILRGDGKKTGYKKYPDGLSFCFTHPEPIYKKQTPTEAEASKEAQRKYQREYRQKKREEAKKVLDKTESIPNNG